MRSDLTGKIVSFALAVGIVTSLFWVMSRSTIPVQETVPPLLQESSSYSNSDNRDLDMPKNRETDTSSYHPQTQATEADQRRQIYKCELSSGSSHQANYSDQKCSDTQRTTTINVRETSGGFISPDPQTIANTRAKIRTDMQQPSATAIVNELAVNHPQYPCPFLASEINAIDAASKERNSGQAQQQLRLRREQVRTQQFRLGC